MTQAELAVKVGVHQKTIVNWEAQGVPRKSEYKVERILGKELRVARSLTALEPVFEQIDRNRAAEAERAARRSALKELSDMDLLQELVRRERQRLVLRERPAGFEDVTGMTEDDDHFTADLRDDFDLAASHDNEAPDPTRGE